MNYIATAALFDPIALATLLHASSSLPPPLPPLNIQ
jgi:hypothetical protein